ncbi:vWA domain-containing protein [Clostridium transplantifaecale]|uniref:vWA domain-containing protein n=1 Tax=Clostridium transplantifaecale TaxID=2479838 RepID=UPI000F62F333|nr:vWA domain-containing protein [Clostridium transplantifaecale]
MSSADKLALRIKKRRAAHGIWRRRLSWMLITCLCITNINLAVFASESIGGDGSLAASPSSATASEADIWMPEDSLTGEELLEEAERAVTKGWKFDFGSMTKKLSGDSEDDNSVNYEQYKELFDGYSSFTLFKDNGEDGRLGGEGKSSYGYIIVRLEKSRYMEYRNGESAASPSVAESSADDGDVATDSETDSIGGYKLNGDERIIFLYMNGSDEEVTFHLNLEDIETSEVVVPAADYFLEEKEEETAATEVTEETEESGTKADEITGEPEDGKEPGGAGGSGSGVSDGSSVSGGSESGNTSDSGDKADTAGDADTGKESDSDKNTDADGKDTDSGKDADSNKDTDSNRDTDGNKDTDSGNGEDSVKDADADKNTDTDKGTDSGKDTNTDAGKDTDSDKAADTDKNADSDKKADSDKSQSSDKNQGAAHDKDSAGKTESGSDKGSADKSGSDSDSGSAGSGSSDSSGEKTVSISSYNVPRVMGPNPDATGEEEDDDISFEEWSEDDEEDDEEDEEDDYGYDDSSAVYDEEDGIIHLNMNLLPAVVVQTRKETPKTKGALKMFSRSKTVDEQIRMVAAETSPRAFSTGTKTYHKQIEYKGDGKYDLHLDVAGYSPAFDIVLVIDNSGSMYDKGYNKTLKNILTENNNNDVDKTKGFVGYVLSQAPGSRFAVVKYDSLAEPVLDWNSDEGNIKSKINGLSRPSESSYGKSRGGTNYEDALRKTEVYLNNRGNSSRTPMVIFLSDGLPTFYNQHQKDNTDTVKYNDLPSSDQGWGIGGTGWNQSGNTSKESLNAGKEFFASVMKKSQPIIYGVGFGEAKIQYFEPIVTGKENSSDDGKSRILVDNGKSLTENFEVIKENMKLKNARIIDKLSENVELPANWEQTAKVYETNTSGSKTQLQKGRGYQSLGYNESTREITLFFGKSKELTKGNVYELVFEVEVSKTAKDKYVSDGYQYPDRGDADTDYNTRTSSGQAGFYSNDNALLIYGATADMTFTYPKPVVQVDINAKPEHRKYIEDKTDGTFELTLDVTSDVGTITEETTNVSPADIVFVLDRTTSMDLAVSGSSSTRLKVVNGAVEKMMNELHSQEYDISYKGVQFAGSTGSDEDLNIIPSDGTWLQTKGTYNNNLKITDTAIYTRPNPALRKGIGILKTGSPANQEKEGTKKHIIFLTDGAPQYVGINWGSDGIERSTTQEIADLESNPLDFPSGTIVHIIACGIDLRATDNTSKCAKQYLEKIKTVAEAKGATVATYQQALSVEEVNTVFEKITDSIISTSTTVKNVKNAVITDKLSEYAEFVNPAADAVRVSVGGKTLTRGTTEYSNVIDSITFSPEENPNTITVTFNPQYVLEKDVTHSISFPVKPTAKAYAEYSKGYLHEGDSGTDVPDTDEADYTSSGKAGFYSNSEATLRYTFGDKQNEMEYKKPVLQVSQGRLQIRKVVEGNKVASDADKEFIIHVKDEDGNTYTSVVLKDKEESPYIYVNGTATFVITESVPMEYVKQSGIVITDVKTGGSSSSSNGTVTVKPGDDLLVEIDNTLTHKNYFHSDDAVTNYTTGDRNVPFKDSREGAKAVAENQPKAGLAGDDEDNTMTEEGETLE